MRTLCIFKIAVPTAKIRFAGGRNLRFSRENQKIAIENCVESILIGNYLTTIGITPEEDIKTVKALGKLIVSGN